MVCVCGGGGELKLKMTLHFPQDYLLGLILRNMRRLMGLLFPGNYSNGQQKLP